MKKLYFLLAVMIVTISSYAQPSRKSPHDTVSSANVTVTYGRPYKNNRDIFGGLEKFGKVWRLGADEATTITFKTDVKVGKSRVKAGTYTMFALVNPEEWTIILNAKLGQWGAFAYEENAAQDIAKIKVPVTKLSQTVEQLTIRFEENKMIIEWDNTQVVVPVRST